jgi:hypothetical protein
MKIFNKSAVAMAYEETKEKHQLKTMAQNTYIGVIMALSCNVNIENVMKIM